MAEQELKDTKRTTVCCTIQRRHILSVDGFHVGKVVQEKPCGLDVITSSCYVKGCPIQIRGNWLIDKSSEFSISLSITSNYMVV